MATRQKKPSKPLEAFWRVLSPEEQKRIAAEFREFVQRDLSDAEAVLYIVRLGLCGPEVPERFAPTLNREIQKVISEYAMVKNMRIKLMKLRKAAQSRNDTFEDKYLTQLLDNLVREQPNNAWLKPPD